MAKIGLTNLFTPIPEGDDIFRIYDVEYKEEFGSLKVYLVNAKGRTTIQTYNFIDPDTGDTRDWAYNAFSYFARTAMNDTSLEDVDPLDLIDKYIQAEVVHSEVPKRDNPSEMMIFVNLKNYKAATGFTDTPTDKALTLGKKENAPKEQQKEAVKQETKKTNVLDLLND